VLREEKYEELFERKIPEKLKTIKLVFYPFFRPNLMNFQESNHE